MIRETITITVTRRELEAMSSMSAFSDYTAMMHRAKQHNASARSAEEDGRVIARLLRRVGFWEELS